MGAVTAVQTSTPPDRMLLELESVDGGSELDVLHEFMEECEWMIRSATFEPSSERIDDIRVCGELEESLVIPRIEAAADLKSLYLTRDTDVGASATGQPLESNEDIELSEWQSVLFVVTVLAYSMREVDRFIERNGLRPVVDEVKERRWAIMLAATILTAYGQL